MGERGGEKEADREWGVTINYGEEGLIGDGITCQREYEKRSSSKNWQIKIEIERKSDTE